MLCHLLLDSCQKAIKPALVVYFGKLLGKDFVTKLLALTMIDDLIWAADKKLFCQMSNTQQCLHHLLPNHENSKISKSGTSDITISHIEPNLFKTVF